MSLGFGFRDSRFDTVRGAVTTAVGELAKSSGAAGSSVDRNVTRAMDILLSSAGDIPAKQLQELSGHFAEIGASHPEGSRLLGELSSLFSSTESSALLFLSESVANGLNHVSLQMEESTHRPQYTDSLRHSLGIRIQAPRSDVEESQEKLGALSTADPLARIAENKLDELSSFSRLMSAIPADRIDIQNIFLDKLIRLPEAKRETMLGHLLKRDTAAIVASFESDLAKLIESASKTPPIPQGEKLDDLRALWVPMKKFESAMLAAAEVHPKAYISRLLKPLESEFENIRKVEAGVAHATPAFFDGVNNNVRAAVAEFRTGMALIRAGLDVEFGSKTPARDELMGKGVGAASKGGAKKPIMLDIDVKATRTGVAGGDVFWVEVKNYKPFYPSDAAESTFSQIKEQLVRLRAAAEGLAADTGAPPPTVQLNVARDTPDVTIAAFRDILGDVNVFVALGQTS